MGRTTAAARGLQQRGLVTPEVRAPQLLGISPSSSPDRASVGSPGAERGPRWLTDRYAYVQGLALPRDLKAHSLTGEGVLPLSNSCPSPRPSATKSPGLRWVLRRRLTQLTLESSVGRSSQSCKMGVSQVTCGLSHLEPHEGNLTKGPLAQSTVCYYFVFHCEL